MPLEHPSSPGRAVARRRWYRPALEPLPPEPGRLAVCALLGRARRARGCVTAGDDRLETRLYAVKRYLFRLGHAARSARYATSVEQLVLGLAAVMGWGEVPRAGAERARFVRSHRKSVQRWLDDLQAAGLVDHEPERDEHGRWWRTQIVLLAAPDALAEELRAARDRAHGWGARQRHRDEQRAAGASLTAIRAQSSAPNRRDRSRLARRRATARHEHIRRAAIERILRSGRQHRELLTHPFGAPPTSAPAAVSSERSRQDGTVVMRTGARPPEDGDPFDELVLRRVAERRDQDEKRAELVTAHARRRARAVATWPLGKPCPPARLREAWVVYRCGDGAVVDSGAAAAGHFPATKAPRAIRLYEQFRAERPAGWPESGPAALLALAAQRRAEVLAGDVARLLILAKRMRAAALEREADRLRRQRERAVRRAAPAEPTFRFRRTPRWESPEQRRRHVRDQVLLEGGDPALWPNAALALSEPNDRPELTAPDTYEALDGIGARAASYRRSLGGYRLAPTWPQPDPSIET